MGRESRTTRRHWPITAIIQWALKQWMKRWSDPAAMAGDVTHANTYNRRLSTKKVPWDELNRSASWWTPSGTKSSGRYKYERAALTNPHNLLHYSAVSFTLCNTRNHTRIDYIFLHCWRTDPKAPEPISWPFCHRFGVRVVAGERKQRQKTRTVKEEHTVSTRRKQILTNQ